MSWSEPVVPLCLYTRQINYLLPSLCVGSFVLTLSRIMGVGGLLYCRRLPRTNTIPIERRTEFLSILRRFSNSRVGPWLIKVFLRERVRNIVKYRSSGYKKYVFVAIAFTIAKIYSASYSTFNMCVYYNIGRL